MNKKGLHFRTGVLLVLILIIVLYIVLNNMFIPSSEYSKNLSKNSCLKGKLNATETDQKNCKISCATEFEEKIKPEINCPSNKTGSFAVCTCQRTIYNTYIKGLF